MKRGIVIFAYNSSDIDYQAMARWSASRILRHLNLPTTLITNSVPEYASEFDDVIITDADVGGNRFFSDLGQNVTWYNGNRMEVYNLSPYNETLILDADYVVCSDQLLQLFNDPNPFIATRWAYDVTSTRTFDDLNYFGRVRMPMAWATVMRFNRSLTSKLIFDSMAMVRENWQHYRHLYGINKTTYRNDHALSIALNIVHGYQANWPSIPWPLASVVPEHKLEQISEDKFKISYITSNNSCKHITIAGQDFHAMGKKHLGEIIANQR